MKGIIEAYKNRNMSGQQQFLNWLVKKLPETTKNRVEELYRAYFTEPEENLLKSKKKSLQGEKPEKFYRVIVDEND